jgi:electron transport complex protein RnfA
MLIKLAAIFFSMILVNNYVLVKFYGICPFLGVSKKLDSAVGMSGAVIFVMFMATAVTFPLQIFVLNPAGLSYLQTIVFILVIAVLVQFIEIFLKKYVVALYNSLGVYLPLITTNCCVLAVTILVVDDYGADVEALGFGAAYIEALVPSAQASASCWLWSCSAACASAWRPVIPRLPSRACPSLCWPQRSPACPSWALAASLRICLT